ncbi:PIN-like domain-containing protein [Pseudoxanthomonas sp. LARHCG66]
MRQAFGEFYGPKEAELKRLITEGLVVLDANVLLQAYELPKESREALLDTLERLRDRLWIPYQVGLEYQARRLTVIARQLGELDGIVERGVAGFQKLQSEIDGLELQKQGVAVDDTGLKEGLAKAEAELREVVGRTRKSAVQVSHDDPIRDRIDRLFEGRVGLPPANQAEVEAMNEAAQKRYDCAIPPGFKDANKDRDAPKAGLYARGIRFERKYGDYYLWVQTMAHVRDSAAKAVLFVTSDAKRDWWHEVKDVTVGPLPALVREMQKEGGAELFWMYSLGRFLGQANEHLHANVSEVALREVNESEAAARHSSFKLGDALVAHYTPPSEELLDPSEETIRAISSHYLERGFVTRRSASPDLMFASRGDVEIAIRLISYVWPLNAKGRDIAQPLAMRVREIAQETPPFGGIHVVVTLPFFSALSLITSEQFPSLVKLLSDVARDESVEEISVGSVTKGVFRALYTHRSEDGPT